MTGEQASPLVSVVVPVYQVEPYIRDCLDSILGQTYSHLEIIVVDDGSPDACPQICDDYAACDARVSVIHQPNGGLSSARNAGIARASGEYLAFVDSDDVVAPAFVETLVDMARGTGADIAQCGFTRDASRLKAGRGVPGGQGGNGVEVLTALEATERLQLEHRGTYAVVWDKLYARLLFEGVRFPVGRQHEDEFVTYRLLWKARRVCVSDEPLYWYRRRTESITGQDFNLARLDSLEAFRERATFYRAQGEDRLAVLTEAVACHRLRALMPAMRRAMPPEAADAWRGELHRLFGRVMRSSEVGARKKAMLCLQMLSPRLRGLMGRAAHGDER